jgi:hypothetical protein
LSSARASSFVPDALPIRSTEIMSADRPIGKLLLLFRDA